MASGDARWRNPMMGSAGCCARAARGQMAAVLPRRVMNCLRFIDCLRGAEMSSLLRRCEIPKVGRCLILLGRHQEPVPAQEIVFLVDFDLGVVRGRIEFYPDRTRIGIEHVLLVDGPRARESMVDDGHLVMQDLWIGLVAIHALLRS